MRTNCSFNLRVLIFWSADRCMIYSYLVPQTASKAGSTFKENCSQCALWIILSNKDIVPGKTCCYWCFQCFEPKPRKYYSPLVYWVAADPMCQNNQMTVQMLSEGSVCAKNNFPLTQGGNILSAKQCNILCLQLSWALAVKVTIAVHIFARLTETQRYTTMDLVRKPIPSRLHKMPSAGALGGQCAVVWHTSLYHFNWKTQLQSYTVEIYQN